MSRLYNFTISSHLLRLHFYWLKRLHRRSQTSMHHLWNGIKSYQDCECVSSFTSWISEDCSERQLINPRFTSTVNAIVKNAGTIKSTSFVGFWWRNRLWSCKRFSRSLGDETRFPGCLLLRQPWDRPKGKWAVAAANHRLLVIISALTQRDIKPIVCILWRFKS